MTTRRVCVFGDSIVWGAFDEERNGWVHRLQQMFNRDHVVAEVYNLGVCGEGAIGLSQRLEKECDARRPTDIVVAIGINDAAYFGRPTEDFNGMFAERYEQLIRSTYPWRRCGVRSLFLGLTPVDERLTHPTQLIPNLHYTMAHVRGINGRIWLKTQEFEVPYLPLLDALDITTDLSDGLHPNASGHRKISELVYERLTEK